MRNLNLSQSPESNCPKFMTCQINRCPLSRNFEKLKNFPSDPAFINKEKCTSKNIRKEIGKAFGLKYGGMTTREFNGAKRWAEMNEEDKKTAVNKLKQISPIARLSEKGYTICPKRKINRETHGQDANNGVFMGSVVGSGEGLDE